jgi:predicted TIM-barrel fold metal-dependent hydrolase
VDVGLIDHHCHAIAGGSLDGPRFDSFLTESDRPPPPGCSAFDTLLGISVRRWCAPLLDLPVRAAPDQYVARRRQLGGAEVNRRLLTAAGLEGMLVDTGLAGDDLLGPAELEVLSGVPVREVVRLEALAEEVAALGVGAGGFAGAFAEALARRAADAVALKSIVAYRHGLAFEPSAPSRAELLRAVDGWLAGGGGRLDDIVILRHLIWQGLATGLPLQLHTGFGDPDEVLHHCDPALLSDFLRATVDAGPPVLLLHCYPYHRHAAYLANIFPHVYLDVGLAVPHVGPRAAAVLAETLELAPFHKLLYSSDAYGLAELYVLAAAGFRAALGDVLATLPSDDRERHRVAALIGWGNARRVYGLDW